LDTISGLLNSAIPSGVIGLSKYKITLPDTSTSSGLYLQYSGVFLLSILYYVGLFLSGGCVSRHAVSDGDELQAITC
jgi:hypothetical protein